eukprot:m.376587 g.376587  ORF g.376587 m.376587 type:complete len:206 (+) comp83743_c0_seq1:658-1275(+)
MWLFSVESATMANKQKTCKLCAVAGVKPMELKWFQFQDQRGTCLLNAANHCLGEEALTVEDMERHRNRIWQTEKARYKRLKKKMPKAHKVHQKRSPAGYWTVQVLQAALQERGYKLDRYRKVNLKRFYRRNGPAWNGKFLFNYYNEFGGSHMVCLRGNDRMWCDSANEHAHVLPECTWDAIHNMEVACKYSLHTVYRIVTNKPPK